LLWHTQDTDDRHKLKAENSRWSDELDCVQSELMQQRHQVNQLAEKCKHLEFLIACLEDEKTALQETNQKLNNTLLQFQW